MTTVNSLEDKAKDVLKKSGDLKSELSNLKLNAKIGNKSLESISDETNRLKNQLELVKLGIIDKRKKVDNVGISFNRDGKQEGLETAEKTIREADQNIAEIESVVGSARTSINSMTSAGIDKNGNVVPFTNQDLQNKANQDMVSTMEAAKRSGKLENFIKNPSLQSAQEVGIGGIVKSGLDWSNQNIGTKFSESSKNMIVTAGAVVLIYYLAKRVLNGSGFSGKAGRAALLALGAMATGGLGSVAKLYHGVEVPENVDKMRQLMATDFNDGPATMMFMSELFKKPEDMKKYLTFADGKVKIDAIKLRDDYIADEVKKEVFNETTNGQRSELVIGLLASMQEAGKLAGVEQLSGEYLLNLGVKEADRATTSTTSLKEKMKTHAESKKNTVKDEVAKFGLTLVDDKSITAIGSLASLIESATYQQLPQDKKLEKLQNTRLVIQMNKSAEKADSNPKLVLWTNAIKETYGKNMASEQIEEDARQMVVMSDYLKLRHNLPEVEVSTENGEFAFQIGKLRVPFTKDGKSNELQVYGGKNHDKQTVYKDGENTERNINDSYTQKGLSTYSFSRAETIGGTMMDLGVLYNLSQFIGTVNIDNNSNQTEIDSPFDATYLGHGLQLKKGMLFRARTGITSIENIVNDSTQEYRSSFYNKENPTTGYQLLATAANGRKGEGDKSIFMFGSTIPEMHKARILKPNTTQTGQGVDTKQDGQNMAPDKVDVAGEVISEQRGNLKERYNSPNGQEVVDWAILAAAMLGGGYAGGLIFGKLGGKWGIAGQILGGLAGGGVAKLMMNDEGAAALKKLGIDPTKPKTQEQLKIIEEQKAKESALNSCYGGDENVKNLRGLPEGDKRSEWIIQYFEGIYTKNSSELQVIALIQDANLKMNGTPPVVPADVFNKLNSTQQETVKAAFDNLSSRKDRTNLCQWIKDHPDNSDLKDVLDISLT